MKRFSRGDLHDIYQIVQKFKHDLAKCDTEYFGYEGKYERMWKKWKGTRRNQCDTVQVVFAA